jgi:hypothetical protein
MSPAVPDNGPAEGLDARSRTGWNQCRRFELVKRPRGPKNGPQNDRPLKNPPRSVVEGTRGKHGSEKGGHGIVGTRHFNGGRKIIYSQEKG